jgi:SPP1 gp7 family putative phage head morphogenesis protein
MAATPELLIEIATRHQVHLERVKTHDAKAFEAFLKKMDREISKRLQGKDLTAFTRKRLETLLAKITDDLNAIYDAYRGVYTQQMTEIAQYEAEFEARSLGQVIEREFVLPTAAQLTAAVFTAPLSVEGPDKGKLLESFYRGWSQKAISRVEGAIRSGYYQGQTTNDILRTIRGTREQRFLDGLLQMSNKDAALMVRTGLQHCACTARQDVWKKNSDVVKGWRLSVTFDSRTSPICRSLGELREVYKVGEGPVPPLHIGCRSSTEAVIDERYNFLDKDATRFSRGADGIEYIPAEMGYYGWLKTQPRSFIESAIGKKRAQLLLGGGLSAERFAELGLGRNFDPLPLYGRDGKKGMADLEPIAFERAGL